MGEIMGAEATDSQEFSFLFPFLSSELFRLPEQPIRVDFDHLQAKTNSTYWVSQKASDKSPGH